MLIYLLFNGLLNKKVKHANRIIRMEIIRPIVIFCHDSPMKNKSVVKFYYQPFFIGYLLVFYLVLLIIDWLILKE